MFAKIHAISITCVPRRLTVSRCTIDQCAHAQRDTKEILQSNVRRRSHVSPSNTFLTYITLLYHISPKTATKLNHSKQCFNCVIKCFWLYIMHYVFNTRFVSYLLFPFFFFISLTSHPDAHLNIQHPYTHIYAHSYLHFERRLSHYGGVHRRDVSTTVRCK